MDERVALVTGASRGIGLEVVRQLLLRGWKVGMLARGQVALEQAAAAFDPAVVAPIVCDVSEAASVENAVAQVVDRFGPVGALVNNAGVIDPVGLMHETDAADWIRLVQINIGGAMLASRAVLPSMLARSKGVIVNLSSGAAHTPIEGWSAYCTSKAGLAMFTDCLAAEYSSKGIRVFGFIPGVVGTDMLNGAQRKFDNVIARLGDDIKLTPDLPARCIAWLIDAGEGEVTGVEQSIRDPELRAKVGLEERAKW
ncbi:MAG: SDR family oxidoreductase [Devosia sp.]|nr:SDR family oxidoreductase [Devosia sp.]